MRGAAAAPACAGIARTATTDTQAASTIVARFHGSDAGTAAEQHFDTVFKAKAVPDDIPELAVGALERNEAGRVFLPALLVSHLGVGSNGEARRLIQQGGVKVDGQAHDAGALEVEPDALAGRVLQVGKRRFLRIVAGA